MTERIAIEELVVGGTEPLISAAIRWGDLLFLSTRGAIDQTTMELVSDDFEAQARNVLDLIMATLAEAGSGPEYILRAQCYLLRAEDFGTWNRIWAEYVPRPRPARTMLVTGFMVPNMLVEVEVTAGVPAGS
jgi:enamine deaminase RidA (YjgF/YER057c/UK114 family)